MGCEMAVYWSGGGLLEGSGGITRGERGDYSRGAGGLLEGSGGITRGGREQP
jgi:hypothetical protein